MVQRRIPPSTPAPARSRRCGLDASEFNGLDAPGQGADFGTGVRIPQADQPGIGVSQTGLDVAGGHQAAIGAERHRPCGLGPGRARGRKAMEGRGRPPVARASARPRRTPTDRPARRSAAKEAVTRRRPLRHDRPGGSGADPADTRRVSSVRVRFGASGGRGAGGDARPAGFSGGPYGPLSAFCSGWGVRRCGRPAHGRAAHDRTRGRSVYGHGARSARPAGPSSDGRPTRRRRRRPSP